MTTLSGWLRHWLDAICNRVYKYVYAHKYVYALYMVYWHKTTVTRPKINILVHIIMKKQIQI